MLEYRLLDHIGCIGYRVGNDGSIWSCWKKQHTGLGKRGTRAYISNSWQKLNGRLDKDGYHIVGVKQKDGHRKELKVHRIVLEVFVGPCPSGMVCRHLDGNPANNQLENLTWGTQRENSQDKERHGRGNKGEKHGNAILTSELVWEIKVLYADGTSQSELAKLFNVSRWCIADIVNGINWKHITI